MLFRSGLGKDQHFRKPLSEAELKRVGKYEKDNKDRGSLRKEMKQKTKTTS